MTLREELVAQAPSEIPDLFTHVEPPKPHKPTIDPDLIFWMRKDLDLWLDTEKPPNVVEWLGRDKTLTDAAFEKITVPFYDLAKAYWAKLEVWEKSNELARIGQWPWFWADNVLANEPKEPTKTNRISEEAASALLAACKLAVDYYAENCQTGVITLEELLNSIHSAVDQAEPSKDE